MYFRIEWVWYMNGRSQGSGVVGQLKQSIRKRPTPIKNFSLIMNFYSCVLSTSPFKKILTWPPPPLSSQRLLNHYFFSKHSKILLSTSLKIWDKTCYVKCCFSWTGSWKCVHKIASEAFSTKIYKRTVETIGRNWSH